MNMVIRCFLCFWVVLNISCDMVVDGSRDKKSLGLMDMTNSKTLLDNKDDDKDSSSGTKKFEEPNYFDPSQETNFKDTSSIVNDNLPEIKGKDVTPEQEMLMAASQDSDYQQASVGDVNGQVFGALTGRSLGHSFPTADGPEDDESLSSDNMMAFGNFSDDQGGESEDYSDLLSSPNKQRQQIHYPDYRDPRLFHGHPFMKAPMPYPATIHVRLPGGVQVLPKVYPVHDYKDVPIPVRYHKVQSVDSPYYVPYKAGPDVDETHLDVFHPGKSNFFFIHL